MLDGAPIELATSELLQTAPVERKPRVWTVFLAFVAALVGATIFQAALCAILVSWWTAQGVALDDVVKQLPKKLGTWDMFLLLASCAQLAMAITALTAANLSPTPWRERLGLVPPRSSLRLNLQAMMGSLVPLSIGFALALALSSILPADPGVQALLESMSPVGWVAFILFIATVPAVVEEILFRGYMQRRFLERWQPWHAIGATSLLFALMHVMPQAIVALLPLSVWLGVVAWRTGSVYPSMLCHAFINGGVNIWRAIVAFFEVSEPVQIVVFSMILLTSLACFLLACREMFSWNSEENELPGESSASQNSPTTV